LWLIFFSQPTFALIPAEYRPNYKFSAELDKVQEINDKINSKRKGWQAVETFYFRELLKNYNTLFEYMPQTRDFKPLYEDCRVWAEALSITYDPSRFSEFYNNCLAPLNEKFKEIENNYTVSAKILANPVQWSAPLTVTFDARWSSDAVSKTTIPSNNHFWYYTDTNWVEQAIWRGPTVKHTFTKEGNYVVHLTVRSANANDGIFDAWADININVWPQAAKLVLLANGRRLRDDIPIKFTSQEANEGIRIDWWATTPLWWRQIMRHEWVVTNSENQVLFRQWSFSNNSRNNWAPWSFNLPLRSNGVYNVMLTIQDNENNIMEASYDLIISDPIATVKASPAEWGTTSTTYSFDASTSYSVQSSIRTYRWVITDEDWNEITSQSAKSFQYKFAKAGTYRVRLRVADELWNDNEEWLNIFVDSTSPTPQFTYEPTKQRVKPSEFTLDASSSFDVDTVNWWESISYERWFTNNDNVTVDKTFDNGKRIMVSFKEKWTYGVTLTVRDSSWKIAQITRDIQVTSTLRPRFAIKPSSVKLGENINFMIKSNKNISNYRVDYGDGKVENNTKEEYSYKYKTVWMYVINVTAYTDTEENTISTTVFVWDANKPLPAYSVLNSQSEFVLAEWTCSAAWVNYPAYIVERYGDMTIDASESLNVQGAKNNLIYYFKWQYDSTTVTRQQLRYTFDELWCQYVDFTLEDTFVSKTERTRIWFVVKNAKPRIDNVLMNFPQLGSTYGIGFWVWQQSNSEQFAIDSDPLVVKVDAINPIDPDGSISKFKWYFYNTDDPNRLLEIKYTPWNTPYTYFTIQRMPWEYMFGVEVYDNDWEWVRSEVILWKGPIVFFPADTKNTDIPIVTLKVDRSSAKVWDEITLEAVARVTSNRSDFSTNTTYSFDLDGDWTYDIITKDNKITHIYKEAKTYKPRVKATYRERSWIWQWEDVVIEKWIKAGFLYSVVWNVLVVRDASYWNPTSRKFCLDRNACRDSTSGIVEWRPYFVQAYNKPWKYAVRYDIQDANWNTASKWDLIEIGQALPANRVGIVTIPAFNDKWVLSIWNSLENKVLFYVAYSWSWECYVDTDIATTSTDGANRPDMDRDIKCNSEALISYDPRYWKSTIARVYFQEADKISSKDIIIEFLDNDITLDPQQENLYYTIDEIIKNLGNTQPDLTSLLLNLRNSIVARDDSSSIVLQIKDTLEQLWASLSTENTTAIRSLLSRLENATTCSASPESCNDYQSSKGGIIRLFPQARKEEIAKIFEEIENSSQQAQRADLLKKIKDIGDEELAKGTLNTEDIEQLGQEICRIVIYYGITWTSCVDPNEDPLWETPADGWDTDSGWSSRWGILKVIWIIVGILWLWFIILVIIFALKAKKKQEVAQ
jgi:PKD repeat protein